MFKKTKKPLKIAYFQISGKSSLKSEINKGLSLTSFNFPAKNLKEKESKRDTEIKKAKQIN